LTKRQLKEVVRKIKELPTGRDEHEHIEGNKHE
jgi:hypothetical protein